MESTTTPTAQSVKARIEKILKAFDTPEMRDQVSGIIYADNGQIDDGDYGDPMKSTKPDFIKKELDGWE